MPGYLQTKNKFLVLMAFIYCNIYSLNLDSIYIFRVNRAVNHPNVTFPFQDIPENQYKEIDSIITYKIKFSSGYDSVYIYMPERLQVGIKNYESNDTIKFRTENAPGGRFVVYGDLSLLHAELTLYGSGIPIVRSEKGHMMKETVSIKSKTHSILTGEIKAKKFMMFTINGKRCIKCKNYSDMYNKVAPGIILLDGIPICIQDVH